MPSRNRREAMSLTRVALGPRAALHVGVHGSLMDAPPAGIAYSAADMVHVFILPHGVKAPVSPFVHLHWFEGIATSECQGMVHSARLPVLNQPRWVTDTDDVLLPILLGRAYLECDAAGRVRVREGVPDGQWHHIGRRCANMLTAFGHSSCLGILCQTNEVRRSASSWIDSLQIGELGDAVQRKLQVVYPTQRSIDTDRLFHKWADDRPLHVVFCCQRDVDRKQGAMALRIFARLAGARHRECLKFTYIGPRPTSSDITLDNCPPDMTLHPHLTREEVSEVFADAHILFHPSRFETLGTVVVQAAAAGMGIVLARDLGGVGELLGSDGACFVARSSLCASDQEHAFEASLRDLLSHRERAKRMGLRNHAVSNGPPWSIAYRDRLLRAIYHKEVPTGKPIGLRVADLPYRAQGEIRLVSSADLITEGAEWCRHSGRRESIDVPFDLPTETLSRGLVVD